jgi:hypothetical protein
VNVPAMSFQLHEWDIHIVCSGTGGARVTKVRSFDLAATATSVVGRFRPY